MNSEVLTREDINYKVADQSLSHIINFNEYLVLEIMRENYQNDPALCQCSLCIEDIYALSLNKIPPRYIQPTNINIYKKTNTYIPREEIESLVLSAIKTVKEKPNH